MALVFLVAGNLAEAEITVNYYHVWSGPERMAKLDELIKKFHQKNPDIEIKAELVSQGGMVQKFLTQIAGGSCPGCYDYKGPRSSSVRAIRLSAFTKRFSGS